MEIKDRIKELRRVPANTLRPNPKNWRKHPESQLNAIRAVLQEIGFAGAELVRELDDGSLELIDGHARALIAGNAIVPVLVLDVTEDEADKLLIIYDPLSAMAESDNDALNLLLSSVESDSASIKTLLDSLGEKETFEDLADRKQGGIVDGMELKPDEHYDSIVVLADNVNEWNRLVAMLELPVVVNEKHKRIGMCRAVMASKILELING